MGNHAENEIEAYLPFWESLTESQKAKIRSEAVQKTAGKGEIVHRGSGDCLGFLIVKSGQLRAYVVSEEGKEITVYRMFERDMCLLAASCIFRNIILRSGWRRGRKRPTGSSLRSSIRS